MKGNIEIFYSTYNKAGSKDVGIVISINVIKKEGHIKLPMKSAPNSVAILKENEKTIQERYYNNKGEPYLDIDYTNHGNKNTHNIVPHQHKWSKNKDGKLIREKWEKINNDKRNFK